MGEGGAERVGGERRCGVGGGEKAGGLAEGVRRARGAQGLVAT